MAVGIVILGPRNTEPSSLCRRNLTTTVILVWSSLDQSE
jgi:hypothetical protein